MMPTRPSPLAVLALPACLLLASPALAQRWEPQATGTDAEFRGLSAVGADVVWAGGRGGVYARTADGGATWRADSVPGAAELFFIDAHAVSADTAYLLGTHFDGGLSRVYKTTDGGRSWTLQYERAGEGVFFDGMAFWDAEHGVAFSDPVDGSFLIITTDDGGRTWREVPRERIPAPLPGEAGFAASGTAVAALGDSLAWIGTGGADVARVLYTTDRGRSWAAAPTPLAAGRSAGIFGLAFRDAQNGVAVGGDHRLPDAQDDNVLRTRDGGRTWELLGRTSPAGVRYGVALVPGTPGPTLVAVAPSGSGYSTDGGVTWTAIGTEGYNTVAFTAPGVGWAAGTEGRIARWRAERPE